jgi:uncharacterized protein (TIGR00369 family)
MNQHWLDQLMANEAGPAPPHVRAFKFDEGLKLVRWSEGEVDCDWTLHTDHCSPLGYAFGGFLACVADQVSIFTMESLSPTDTVHLTQDIRLSFFRPMAAGVTYRVEGRAVNRSKAMVFVEVCVRDPAGKLCCKVTLIEQIRPRQDFMALQQ